MNTREFAEALGASRVIELPSSPTTMEDAYVVLRAIHGYLQPSRGRRPGRPTNPKWTLRRQVPFSEATWSRLEEYAAALSTPERKVSPGQLAATILEQVLHAAPTMPAGEEADDSVPAAVGAR
jgi:hypothetical protein